MIKIASKIMKAKIIKNPVGIKELKKMAQG